MHSDAIDSVNIDINPKTTEVIRLFLKAREMESNIT